MGWTKRQFVEQAFGEVGLAAYVYDLTPEQLQAALKRLDVMMAAWNAKGIRLGYPLPGSPQDSDLDTQTNVPDSSNEAVITNLAVRLGPGFGKVISPDLKSIAKSGYDLLLARATMPPEMQMPATMPAGSGNKRFDPRSPFLQPPVDPILAGQDGAIDLY